MNLGLTLGLIMVLGAYMGLLVYYDNIVRLRLPPLLVGLKGSVYPLEKLVVRRIGKYVDPLELESMYSRKDKALGFTGYFITIISVLGATSIILLIVADETFLIIVPLAMLLYLHIYLYKWAKNIKVNYWVNEGKEVYTIGVSVKASPSTRIWIVNEPPQGEVYGQTKIIGKGYVKLEYYWKPRFVGKYSWKPQLVVVEEPNGLLRLDISKNIAYNIIVSDKRLGVKEKKGRGNIERASESSLFGTIREPEVVGVREYVIGDRLKDIIAKSILKPSGPRVRKYRELLERTLSTRERTGAKTVFVLGRLALYSKSYRERTLLVISEIMEENDSEVIVLWDLDGTIYNVTIDALVKGIVGDSPTIGPEDLDSLFREAKVFFIDPSITINIYGRNVKIILPYDWRVEVFESYRNAWEKYIGDIESVFGFAEKI